MENKKLKEKILRELRKNNADVITTDSVVFQSVLIASSSYTEEQTKELKEKIELLSGVIREAYDGRKLLESQLETAKKALEEAKIYLEKSSWDNTSVHFKEAKKIENTLTQLNQNNKP